MHKLLKMCWLILKNQRGSFPKFGVAGGVEQETHGYQTDQLEYTDGFETDIFSLKFSDTLRRSAPSSCAHTWGIQASGDNGLDVPLDTVTMVETEEATTPHMIATKPDQSPILGDKLTYTDGLIFFRTKKTITIVGRGDPPAGMGTADRGNTYAGPLSIGPAVGAAPLIEGSDLYISRVEIGKSVTDWNKFTIELTRYDGNTVEKAQVNMIDPSLFTTEELKAISAWYRITRTTTLNGKDKANIEEAVDIFDDVASA